ncbi:ChbG/HpnK family deacetylase [Microvirga sp. 2MCAF38]|uniref:ChbG/HpnK family deacetylase n=1 Tax=Microvirga sp. 2MCAF38 TaxID=3232989 RepID=UPI003F9E0A91
MSFPRPVVLCADDFGLTDGVSRGILELAGMGRISATSVMSNMPAWTRNAGNLKPFSGRIGIGLHLNLTTGVPLGAMPTLAPNGSFPSLETLLRKAFSGQIPSHEIRADIDRQIDTFEKALGSPPSFVDGHQHVHVLPGVRHVLLDALKARGYAGRLWIRDPSDSLSHMTRRGISAGKAVLVGAFALGFAGAARKAGFAVNEGFSGFSPLSPEIDPAPVFKAALSHLGPRPLVMCHPGYVDAELIGLDPVLESRQAELQYLRSEDFGALLEERGIRLVPGLT